MTPEELADKLIGTCDNTDPCEELENAQDLARFDMLAFLCEGCGWWCSTDELHNIGPRDLCQQCNDEDPQE